MTKDEAKTLVPGQKVWCQYEGLAEIVLVSQFASEIIIRSERDGEELSTVPAQLENRDHAIDGDFYADGMVYVFNNGVWEQE